MDSATGGASGQDPSGQESDAGDVAGVWEQTSASACRCFASTASGRRKSVSYQHRDLAAPGAPDASFPMKLLRHHPFVLLAVITVALGALWHSRLLEPGARELLEPAMQVVGAPFIVSMRLAIGWFGRSAVTPIAGLILGLLPYVGADWLLRWRRQRLASTTRVEASE